MSKSYAKPTGSSGIQKTALGRTCPSCGDRYLAVVVDDHGRQRRDECGCYVEIVDMEIEDDSDEQLVTDGGLDITDTDKLTTFVSDDETLYAVGDDRIYEYDATADTWTAIADTPEDVDALISLSSERYIDRLKQEGDR